MTPAAARPFLKWAGGKGRLLKQFGPYFPARYRGYIEPFLGSGAVFFHLAPSRRPERTILADSNEELILAYRAVRDRVEAVNEALAVQQRLHGKTHYYEVRSRRPEEMAPAERAARLIYLNRTCFNGLYRVNSRGEFNVPIGSYAHPRILDSDNLRRVSLTLQRVELRHEPFFLLPDYCRRGEVIYFDPPYQPISPTSSFTAYTPDAFKRSDQERLAGIFAALDRIGCRLMLSNSDSPLIRKLYGSYRIHPVRARRVINSRADRRGPVRELLIRNY